VLIICGYASGKKFGVIAPLIAPISILQQITAIFLVVKGFFITGYSTTTCMQPEKKTEKLPLLPVLAGAMILIPLLLAAGCTGQAPEPRLGGTGWTLTGYVHNGTPVQALTTTKVTLDFGNESKISGTAGCNHYFASYEVKGTAITIGQAGSTMMYCGEPGVMDQESAYLTLLGQAKSIIVDGDQLTLADAKGTTILTFVKTVPPAPEPLVGTNWTLESFHTADAVSSVIAGTRITALFGDDGQVSGSAGCNRYFASFNVTGTSLSIGTAGSTKMACGTPGVMQQESAYLSLLGKTKTFTIKGDRLTLADVKGTPILTFAKSVMPA
jgi:heat shock protein HslJ